MQPAVSFPLPVGDPKAWAELFPARHGRVSFGQFERCEKASPEMVRAIASVHFEFTDFHKRISAPLNDQLMDGIQMLSDYTAGLVGRLETGKSNAIADTDYLSLSAYSLLTELIQVCLVEESVGLTASRFPRWLMRHTNMHIEQLAIQAESIVESEDFSDESKFWEIIKSLAILDLSPVIAKLLGRYLDLMHSSKRRFKVSRFSAELLLAFFEEVPSLYDLGLGSRSREDAIAGLEKRRNIASVAFFKDKEALSDASPVNFVWRLQIGAEDDMEFLKSHLINAVFPSEDMTAPWYQKAMLLWTWMHPLDEPSAELMKILGSEIAADAQTDMTASVVDAGIYSVLASDMLSFISIVVGESSVFSPWIIGVWTDVIFYAGGFVGETAVKIRDALLMNACHWLKASGCLPAGLGARLAVDIVLTLSEGAASRGSAELMGHVQRTGVLNITKQGSSVVHLAHAEQTGLAESLSLEKFHQDIRDGRIIDAIHSLAIAAEVGADINMGACRISDFLDNSENIGEVLREANSASSGVALRTILPEYIESGRLKFWSEWVLVRSSKSGRERVEELVRIVTSPNCPPESIVGIVSEIRHHVTASKSEPLLSLEEGVAVSKILIDLDEWLVVNEGTDKGPIDMLLSWISGEIVKASLHSN